MPVAYLRFSSGGRAVGGCGGRRRGGLGNLDAVRNHHDPLARHAGAGDRVGDVRGDGYDVGATENAAVEHPLQGSHAAPRAEMRIRMLVDDVRSPRRRGHEAGENLARHGCMRVDDVVATREPCCRQDSGRVPQREQIRHVHVGAERCEPLGRRPGFRHDDADGVSAAPELARDPDRDLLTAPDAGVQEIEEHSHGMSIPRSRG